MNPLNFIKGNRFIFYKLLLLLILWGVPFFASSQGGPLNTVTGGFKAEKNTAATGVTVDAHGTCWVVKNSSATRDYFIPTATPAEWAAFIARVPSIPDLSLESCIQCTAGACCNIATGQYYTSSQVCRPSSGACDVAETCTGTSNICPTDSYAVNNTICDACSATGSSGACQLNDTGYRCTGTASSCGTGNPYTCPVNATVNDTVWNGSSWIAKTTATNCGFGAWTCNGAQPRRVYYGCNTSGSCNTTSTAYQTATSCTTAVGGEGSSVCVNGSNTCSNLCSDGLDNDGDGYIDGKDVDCGGCGQCTSGACCNTTTGCFLSNASVCRAASGACDAAETCTGSSAICPTDSYQPNTYTCTSPAATSGACRLTGYKCTGSSSTCGTTIPFYTYTSTSGTVWNGTSWVTPPPQCGAGAYYCNGQEIRQYTLGCDTSGNCNVNSGSVSVTTCTGAENSRCVNGVGTCQSFCSDGIDNDGDTWIDTLDTNCNGSACQQCSTGECCNTATGCFRTNGTYVSNCGKCDGTSATAGNQTSAEDGLGECTSTGSNCQTDYCSGSSRSCGYKTAGTTCNASAGVCDPAETCTGSSYVCPTPTYYNSSTICRTATGSAGSCQLTGDTCSGSSATCGTNPYYVNAPGTPSYPVYTGSTWASATQSTNCGLGPYYCNGNEIRRYYYGCNTSGSCNTGAYAGSYSVTVCGGGENSLCVNGTGTCVNKCSNKNDGSYTGNDDGDAYVVDGADPDCEPQCTSGDCCDITNGVYKAAGTVVGTCGKCTGNSATSVNQASNEDLGSQCGSSGGACQSDYCSGSSRSCGYVSAGTTCRASTGSCDITETCTGSSYDCPGDSVRDANYICNSCTPSGGSGSCQLSCTAYRCDGTIANKGTCPVTRPITQTTNGPASPAYRIWNASSWVTASWALKCNTSAPYCSGQNIMLDYYGCNTSGSCDTGTKVGSQVVATCSGAENQMCENGSCVNKCGGSYIGDDDGNGWADGADAACGGSQQCSSGECCNVATSSYKPAGTYVANCGKCTGSSATAGNQSSSEDGYNGGECSSSNGVCQSETCSGTGRYCGYKTGTTCRTSSGVCDTAETCSSSSYNCPTNAYASSGTICESCVPASGPSGACTIGDTGRYCSGSSSGCIGSTFGCSATASTFSHIWNGSSWVRANASVNCGTAYQCLDLELDMYYLGCNGATCGAYGDYSIITSCGGDFGWEGPSICISGYSTCQNTCGNGIDDDEDGWIDNMDSDCNPSACQQCSPHVSHPCCDSNGCYKAAGTVCGTGSCGTNNYGSSGTCSYTYRVNSCSGSSTSCDGPLVPSGNTCYCSSGTVFNGSSCAAFSSTNYCGLGSPFCFAGAYTSYSRAVRSCNGSGSCKTTDESTNWVTTNCSSGYCVSGTCQNVACTTASHCGTNYNSVTACGGTNNQQIGYVPYTYSCTNNVCSGPTAGSRVVTQTCAGRETHYCSYASCQNLCSNSTDNDGDGYNDSYDTDCCGIGGTTRYTTSHCGLADYGCSAFGCSSYSAGSYPYNRNSAESYPYNISYYCQCEVRGCDPGMYGAGGCCYPCPAGTYNPYGGSDRCYACPAGQWCPGGTAGGIYCPYGSLGSAAGADTCSDCYSGTGGS